MEKTAIHVSKDRVSNRSKGYVTSDDLFTLMIAVSLTSPRVGYVEFVNEESVAAALQLAGQSSRDGGLLDSDFG